MKPNTLKLIEKSLNTQTPTLDFGRCGLTDTDVAENTPLDIALRQCTHLKTLIKS